MPICFVHRTLLAGLAALSLTACGAHSIAARVAPESTPNAAPHGYLISNVNVFDGEKVLGARDVSVRDGVIEAVADPGTLQPRDGDERIDGTGRTLLPGLIDMHAHLESAGEAIWDLGLPNLEEIAQAYVYAGVTTALVMQAGDPQFDLMRSAEQGKVVAPHFYTTGPRLTAPGGFPINLYRALLPWPISSFATQPMRGATTADEARKIVDEISKEYSPGFMKLTCDAFPPGAPKLTAEAMVAAIQRSKELGMRPTAHIGAPEDVMIAADAGLALFAHPPHGGLLTDAQITHLAELKIPFVSTQRFLIASDELGRDHGSTLEKEILRAETLAKFSNRPKDFRYPAVPEGVDPDKVLSEDTQHLHDNLAALNKAGVPIFVGTDAGSPGVVPGASLQRELRALVALGIPTADVLRDATSAPADFLDPKHSFGRVAPGQRADLLLVKGDPIADIAATEAIDQVFLSGRRMERTRAE